MAPDDEPPAQASLGERFVEIRDRIERLIEQIDLRGQLQAHPWELVAGAALLGAWVGFEPPRVHDSKKVRGRLAGALLSAAGAVAIRLAREAAFRQIGEIAKRWWEESGSKVGANGESEARRENGRSDRSHA
jgi:hypothetical protein